MNEEQIAELARIANQILAEELGEPEGTQYMQPNQALLRHIESLEIEGSIDELAKALAKKLLAILSSDFE